MKGKKEVEEMAANVTYLSICHLGLIVPLSL